MKIDFKRILTGSAIAIASFGCVEAADISDYYDIEDIGTPVGLDVQVGGLDFMPDGRLVACFHRGEVYTYAPDSGTWKLFADGLHEPLGVVAVSDSEIVIVQRPELTRIKDTDGDGEADEYSTIYDGFGMSGNYHEFAFGPTRDADGNFLIALNVASNGASIRDEIRGEFRHYGMERGDFYRGWSGSRKTRAGRMYSAVPWRGWVLKVTPDGEAEPIAPGFRSPNGITVAPNGEVWVTDNQGDWLGTSKLFNVRKDRFYGHPASLAWREDWDGRNPLEVGVAELDQLRTRASVLFPQGSMANSPTQPVFDTTSGKFGPFAGQMLIGEMNEPKIVRVMPDEVNGEFQGAVTAFYSGAGLDRGNNRMVFDDAGSLWVGQTHLSWAGGEGLQRIRWKGENPMEVQDMKLTEKGFNITFTRALDRAIAEDVEHYEMERFFFRYHQKYGSAEHDKTRVNITSAKLQSDDRTVALTLDQIVPWRLYRLNVAEIASSDGHAVVNPSIVYTLNHLRGGNTPEPGPETYGDDK